MIPARKCFLTLLLCCTACAPATAQAAATATAAQPTTTDPAALTAEPAATTRPTASPAAATPMLPHAPRAFTETFDGPVPYWTYRQAGNRRPLAAPSVRDGFLVFDLAAANQWAYAIYGGPELGNVTVEARVQSRTNGDGAAGVICRYGKDAGWYELDLFEDGTYQLLFGQWLAEGIANYVPLYRGAAQTMPGEEYTVALQCSGNTLTPLIDGRPQRQWQELKFGLKRGNIGLGVSSFAGVPFRAAFDSVKVSEP